MVYCAYKADTYMDEAVFAPIIEGRRRRSSKKHIIILFFCLLIVIPFVVGGYYLYTQQSQSVASPTPTPTIMVFPTDTPTPTPPTTPTPVVSISPTPKGQGVDKTSGLDKSTLTILVQNGSGVVGAANKAAQLLKTAGYKIAGTQNADAYDYEDVTLSVKSDKAGYLPLLKKDLESEYVVKDTRTTLDASASADAIVIIGK